MNHLLETITKYRLSKGWSEYELAENSGLPQSTISSWYHKDLYPTIPTLKKICDAYGITLSQIFDDNSSTPKLNDNEIKYIETFRHLTKKQQEKLIEFLKSIWFYT